MKIGINTLSVTPQRGGAKTYLLNLVEKLVEKAQQHTCVLFVTPFNKCLFDGLDNMVESVSIPVRADKPIKRTLLEQALVPSAVQRHRIDLLFSPGNSAVLGARCEQVVTVHGSLFVGELRRRYAPQRVSKLRGLYYDLILRCSVRQASKIITVSESIKRSLLKQAKVDASKVAVIYEGVNLELFHPMAMRSGSYFNKPYILFLSTLFRYKNPDRLLQAFALLKRTYGIPHRLVFVGRDPGKQVNRLREMARGLSVTDEVRFAGRVPHHELRNVYAHADVFVYPSTLESFGLPLLEAMACGVPVVGSNRCSVPEIIGDAGLIVDPDDIESLAQAIYRVLTEKRLRRQLIQEGHQRAESFSWERAATVTLGLFEEVHYGGGCAQQDRG